MNLDEAGKTAREVVDNQMLAGTEAEIRRAGVSVRENRLERLPAWCDTCGTCDLVGVCAADSGDDRKH